MARTALSAWCTGPTSTTASRTGSQMTAARWAPSSTRVSQQPRRRWRSERHVDVCIVPSDVRRPVAERRRGDGRGPWQLHARRVGREPRHRLRRLLCRSDRGEGGGAPMLTRDFDYTEAGELLTHYLRVSTARVVGGWRWARKFAHRSRHRCRFGASSFEVGADARDVMRWRLAWFDMPLPDPVTALRVGRHRWSVLFEPTQLLPILDLPWRPLALESSWREPDEVS